MNTTIAAPAEVLDPTAETCDSHGMGRRLLSTVPAAVAAALAVYGISRFGDVHLVVHTGATSTTTIGPAGVAVTAAVAAALGTVTLALLERHVPRGRAIGLWLATIVFVLSLVVGPLHAATPTAALVLGTMHAVVWGAVTGGLRRRC